ncbi:MAG: hypothetical protein HKN76_15915, partial [Saprospiraceae bacterium]|nr:hypothetical protein [Saprospiraceae bacterium]
MNQSDNPILIMLCISYCIYATISCSSSPDLVKNEVMPAPFVQLCAPCHGADLKGNIAQSLLDGSWQFGSRPADLFRAIKFGHPQQGMPSWGGVLADSEIDSLVNYLLREEKRQNLNKPPIPTRLETQDYQMQVEVLTDDLKEPWGMAFIDSERVLITEQPSSLRILQNGKLLTEPIINVGKVSGTGQGGLFDVVIDPEYDKNGWVYLAVSHSLGKPNSDDRRADRARAMTKIIRGKINGNNWVDEQVLFAADPQTYSPTAGHFGGRMIIDRDGYLFFSIGDRDSLDHAQDLSKPNGKIHRIHTDGTIPVTNPFYGQEQVITSIYSRGNRNPQGLALHPETGHLWSTEHGPLGGDELNIIEAGKNYGWPVISHGINYNGELITEQPSSLRILQNGKLLTEPI